MPFYVEATLALVGLAWFLVLQPRNKILVSFALMSSGFDLLPTIVYGFFLRDPGFILLLITWAQLLTRPRVVAIPRIFFMRALQAFVVWATICVIYGLAVEQYPLLLTLKSSRQLILGYCSFFVFVRLYETDPEAAQHLRKWLYRITLVLLPVVLVQYITGIKLFYGLIREYGGAIRALPVFLPILLLYTWYILSRIVAGQRVAWHERVYLVLAVLATALTYTRGIYLAFLATVVMMVVVLARARQMRWGRAFGYLGAAMVAVLVLLAAGQMNRVATRFLSGVSLLGGTESKTLAHAEDIDTFTGRIKLTGERIDLVAEHNPLVGFAFIHENLITDAFRSKLKYGSVVSTPEYLVKYAMGHPYVLSLHSVDVGWADIIVDTGLVGFTLFLLMLGGVGTGAWRILRITRRQPADTWWAMALSLELAMLVLLMFNGNPYVGNVHIVSYMLASLAFCGVAKKPEQRAAAPEPAARAEPVEAYEPEVTDTFEDWRE